MREREKQTPQKEKPPITVHKMHSYRGAGGRACCLDVAIRAVSVHPTQCNQHRHHDQRGREMHGRERKRGECRCAQEERERERSNQPPFPLNGRFASRACRTCDVAIAIEQKEPNQAVSGLVDFLRCGKSKKTCLLARRWIDIFPCGNLSSPAVEEKTQ